MAETVRPAWGWYLFLGVFTPLVAVEFVKLLPDVVTNYKAYIWFAVGLLAYLPIDRYLLKKNADFLKTHSHEYNHFIVSLLFFKKMHSFHSEERSGVIYHEAGGPVSGPCISLAPYCLPLLTYLLLIVAAGMKPEVLWIANIIIGISVAFYVHCFRVQTGSYEPDINKYRPRFFPYWFIFVFLVFNATVIIYSQLPDKNVFLAYADLFTSYWHDIVGVVKGLFS